MNKKSTSASYSVYTNPKFVNEYSKNAENNAWNAHYERPASLSLLPNIEGLNILDAGCGSGIATKIFLDQGATATAIDYSDQMVELAKERTQGKCQILEVDMNNGLPMLANAEFDIIYSSLVIHYIDNLDQLFAEFARVLKPNGILIFSTDHPENPDFLANPITEKRLNEVFWSGANVTMQIYERPWNEITSSIKNARFEIEKTITPQPTDECKTLYPKEYETLSNGKHFICVKGRKKS